MRPAIAPIGIDYIHASAAAAGIEVDVIDLCLASEPPRELARRLGDRPPSLVGLTFRNVDDCFWPQGQSFVPSLVDDVAAVRELTDAPVVLGGVGYSAFASRLLVETGADFGVAGDGEVALPALVAAVERGGGPERVPGLVWRDGDRILANPPSRCGLEDRPPLRRAIDQRTYYRLGGQIGVETRRGCPRGCPYCIDPLVKGARVRRRPASLVADEVEDLARQGVDVLHLCDSEFNVPPDHATAVCEELISRGLHRKVRWYAYLTIEPFPDSLARVMSQAGCVGINFTTDSTSRIMLAAYGHRHDAGDVEAAVRRCRRHGIASMLDLLLGGPGETPETVEETIETVRRIDPDRAGAALGIRLYPGTPLLDRLAAREALDGLRGIRRRYHGPVDLLRPTFYISPELGRRPGALVRDLIGGDERFFPPAEDPDVDEVGTGDGSHNYSDNSRLVDAIGRGARGAFWDILRKLDAETPDDPSAERGGNRCER